MATYTAAAPAFLQRLLRIAAGGFQRGPQSEENSRRERNHQSENHHVGIHADFRGAGKRSWQHAQNCFRAESGKHKANATANGNQKSALHQKLPDNSGLSRAEGSANCKFVCASCGAREQ
jgi:hypothetical protein